MNENEKEVFPSTTL